MASRALTVRRSTTLRIRDLHRHDLIARPPHSAPSVLAGPVENSTGGVARRRASPTGYTSRALDLRLNRSRIDSSKDANSQPGGRTMAKHPPRFLKIVADAK